MWPPTTLHVGPGLARSLAWRIWPPSISQTATAPLLFCSTMSVMPSWFKSPVLATCQLAPGLATSMPWLSWSPFISRMATLPSVFCIKRSVWPLPLKSPVPTTCQLGPGLATTAAWLIWSPFIFQMATLPFVFCSAMSLLPSPLKSPVASTCQEGARVGDHVARQERRALHLPNGDRAIGVLQQDIRGVRSAAAEERASPHLQPAGARVSAEQGGG